MNRDITDWYLIYGLAGILTENSIGWGGDIPYVPAFERQVDYTVNEISIKLLVEQDICIIYVNDRTAMSARVCSIKDKWDFCHRRNS